MWLLTLNHKNAIHYCFIIWGLLTLEPRRHAWRSQGLHEETTGVMPTALDEVPADSLNQKWDISRWTQASSHLEPQSSQLRFQALRGRDKSPLHILSKFLTHTVHRIIKWWCYITKLWDGLLHSYIQQKYSVSLAMWANKFSFLLKLVWNEFLSFAAKGILTHKCSVLSCSEVSDSFETLWTVTHQSPLPMEFSRQEYWISYSRGSYSLPLVPPGKPP